MGRNKHKKKLQTEQFSKTDVQKKSSRLTIVVGLLIVCAVFLFLSWQHISDPFIRVSEDTNGSNGLAAYNLTQYGFKSLKAGIYGSVLKNPADAFGSFYTHHPFGFVLPTVLTYKLWGVSEMTTRLGPLLLSFLGLIAFYIAMLVIFESPLVAVFTSLSLAILPGFVYYGKHFDMQPPALAFMLISYLFFLLNEKKPKSAYAWLFLLSIASGGFVAWFYYFMPISIWIFIAFFKKGQSSPKRKLMLVAIPIILLVAFSLNILQFKTLNGPTASKDLQGAFALRSSSQTLGPWSARLFEVAKWNFSLAFLIFGIIGICAYIVVRKKHSSLQYLYPLFITPLLNMAVFRQWSTHPFGLIFFLPLIAAATGILYFLLLEHVHIKNLSRTGGKIVLALCILGVGWYASSNQLAFFYDKFLIWGPQDIRVIKEIKPQIKDGSLCLGQNPSGIGYGSIIQWYTNTKLSYSPDCLKKETTRGALIFHPAMGDFFAKEAAAFEEVGLKPVGCADTICLLSRIKTKK